MTLAKNYLEKLHKNQLLDLAEFIVTENFKHHSEESLQRLFCLTKFLHLERNVLRMTSLKKRDFSFQ